MSRSCTGELASDWNVWKRINFASAGVLKLSTVAVPLATEASGLAMSNVQPESPLTVSSNFVADCRPTVGKPRGPAKPDLTLYASEDVGPDPETSAGAWIRTGWTTTGIRTTWPLSPVSVSEPFAYALNGAELSVNV